MWVAILCLWCGGAIGQIAFAFTNPAARRGFQHAIEMQVRQHPGRKAYVYFWGGLGALIPIITWPLAALVAPLLIAALKARIPVGSELQPITCACCERKSQAVVFQTKWVSLDCEWYINEEHEVVCSKACAAHLESHHAERPGLH